MLPIELMTPDELAVHIGQRARERRLERALTQAELAQRAGVSLPSLKRFERTGRIALVSLLRLALVLDATTEFAALFKEPPLQSLDQLLQRRPRQRGRRA